MSAAEDYAVTRELRRKKPMQVIKKKMLLDVSCTNSDCRYNYMAELDAGANYPGTVKCPKCGEQADVSRIR